MTIELPVTLDQIRQYQAEQNRISEARVAALRFARGKKSHFNRAMKTMQAKGINLAEVSMDALKKEVEICRSKQSEL
jgi:tRNA isopentenyl-2-thiomethyl-A-37 hydroxylase MiaE